MHPTNSLRQALGRGVLDDESRCPRLERAPHVPGAPERRDDEDPRRYAGIPKRGCRGDAVHPRHLDVEQRHVGPGFADGVEHFVATTDLRDDLQVGFEGEESGERAPHEGLVVSEQQPDRHVPILARSGGDAGESSTTTRRTVPRPSGPDCTVITAPARRARSARPMSPLP